MPPDTPIPMPLAGLRVGLPTQYFLDEDGIIRSIVQGPVTPESAASNLALLGLDPPAGASPSDAP